MKKPAITDQLIASVLRQVENVVDIDEASLERRKQQFMTGVAERCQDPNFEARTQLVTDYAEAQARGDEDTMRHIAFEAMAIDYQATGPKLMDEIRLITYTRAA